MNRKYNWKKECRRGSSNLVNFYENWEERNPIGHVILSLLFFRRSTEMYNFYVEARTSNCVGEGGSDNHPQSQSK